MKKSIIFIALFYCSLVFAFAQEDPYLTMMQQSIAQLDKNASVADFQVSANQFERAATVKTEEWLPNYWAAYCYAMMSYMAENIDTKDQYADQAEKFFKKIEASQQENDEVWVMKAYIAQAKLAADPMSRWQSQGGIFQSALEKAKKLNTQNPRIYLLRGQNLLNTPESFGGGKASACPLFLQADEKFSNFKPVSSIHPDWGRGYMEDILKECK